MKSALLAVSFGTSYRETRERTLEAIERDLCAAFPERLFYRAWTSGRIRKKLETEQGIRYDGVEEAIERMRRDGITDVLVQPTYMTCGGEYEGIKSVMACAAAQFERLRLGAPLLSAAEDVKELAAAAERIFSFVKAPSMLAFIGHGSLRGGFAAYELLEEQFEADGYPNFCVGTAEYEPGFEAVLSRVREQRPDRVYLTPLLVAAGGHALNDMAGDGPDSWKSRLEREKIPAFCLVRGMGEYQEIRDLYVRHARNAEPIVENGGS